MSIELLSYTHCWYQHVCDRAAGGCGEHCVKFRAMRSLLADSNLPMHLCFPPPLVAPPEDLNAYQRLKEIKDDIENWVRGGKNLYIYSKNYGNGKTAWAAKLLFAYFDKVWRRCSFEPRGVFMPLPELFERERLRMEKQDDSFMRIRKALVTAPLVVWDGIGQARLTDYRYDMMTYFISAREDAGKANIYTGNLDSSQICEWAGGSLAHRICQLSEVVQFTAEGARNNNG